MEVEVRRFSESEARISELTELLHRGYAPLAKMGLRFVATYQDDATTRSRIAEGECYVAQMGDRMLGTIIFREAAQTRGCAWYDRPEVASFGQFAVDPAYQGRGIGGFLLDKAERRALETGALEIALDTAEPATHLIEFYGRRGYRVLDTVQWDVTNYRSVIMSKRIDRSQGRAVF